MSLIEFGIGAAPHSVSVTVSRPSVDIFRQSSCGREIRDVVHLAVRVQVFGFPKVLEQLAEPELDEQDPELEDALVTNFGRWTGLIRGPTCENGVCWWNEGFGKKWVVNRCLLDAAALFHE